MKTKSSLSRWPAVASSLRLSLLSLPVLLAACTGADRELDGPEPVGEAVLAATVGEAADGGCSTLSVKGLSEQIVAQSNCISPGAFVLVPDQPNLTMSSTVFPYLEQPARDAFVSALQANPGTSMQVNSMLRTVAQQYLLYRWYLNGQCGIAAAATPGNSNHETGLALDVQQYSTWRTALEAVNFAWFGSGDAVHFDYEGPGAVDYRGTDVLAFQELWNKNNPADTIAEDGAYGPQTEARLLQSPADGFAIGASCGMPPPVGGAPDVHLAMRLSGGQDLFADGASSGIDDVFEGDEAPFEIEIHNAGDEVAGNVDIGIWVEEPFFAAGDYVIETDWQHPGTFEVSSANTDPANPPHGGAPGQTFTLRMQALSPGETKRVTLAAWLGAYSANRDPSPEVRFWVKDVENYYHQDQFDGAATNTDGSQTFNGGVLQLALPSDIYSRAHWEWDTDRREGWTGTGNATVAADPARKVLVVTGDGTTAGAQSPDTAFPAATVDAVTIRGKRSGGAGAARLSFTTQQDPSFDETKSVAVDIPDDGAFHEIAVGVSANAAWAGTITALRVEPFASGPGTLELDYVRAGDVSAGPSDNAPDEPPAAAGCACDVPGRPVSQGAWAGLLLAAAAVSAVRRRGPGPRIPRPKQGTGTRTASRKKALVKL